MNLDIKVGPVGTQLKALELWRHSLVASVRGDAPDLSARQMALLLSVYMEDGAHTVRGLAKALKISKPAVSRALDRLGELNYVRRERDELDRRNVLVQRTMTGSVFLKSFAAMIVEANAIVSALPAREIDFGVGETSSASQVSSSESTWAEAAA
jgi:DNA-binding MarR family transcriptional regulator